MKLADSSRAIIIILVLLLAAQSAFAEQNTSADYSQNYTISTDSNTYSLGQMASISLTYFPGAEIAITNDNAAYRYLSPSSIVLFRPPETGNYTAALYNSSALLANTTFKVLEPETLLWTDKENYFSGEQVRIFIYPNTTNYALSIEHNNESYQFIDQQTYPAIFYPRDSGNYSVTATSAGKTIATSFLVSENLASKVEVNYTYAGDQINFSLQNITPPYSVMVSALGRSYNFIDVSEPSFQFLPEEPGNYTFRFYKDSGIIAELPVEITGQIALDRFPLSQDIMLQINFSEFATQHESFFDRLLGSSPITQMSAYVEGYRDNQRFRMALSSAGQYVFNLQLFSNPAIEAGTYTIVVDVRSGKDNITKKYSFVWEGNAVYAPKHSAFDYVNYSFAEGNDIAIPVNFTNEITTPSSFLDWLLRRSRIDTLVLYVDGQENNALFAPKAQSTGLDNFIVTIKSQGQKPDVYALVAIAMSNGKLYRKTYVFNYGLTDAEEIAAKASRAGVIEVIDQNTEPVTFSKNQQVIGGMKRLTLTFSDQPVTEITISNVSFEEGLISIAASITPPMHVEVKKAYAISPSFSILGTITAIANGTELYRCEDYTPESCNWLFERNITPGQPYTEEITEATAFAEASPETGQYADFSRQQESSVAPSQEVPVKVVITSENVGNAVLKEELPDGWAFASVPSNAEISGNAMTLQLNLTENLTTVNYTLKSPSSSGPDAIITRLSYSGVSKQKATTVIVTGFSGNETLVPANYNLGLMQSTAALSVNVRDSGKKPLQLSKRILSVKEVKGGRQVVDLQVDVNKRGNISFKFRNLTLRNDSFNFNVEQLDAAKSRDAGASFVKVYSIDTTGDNFTSADVTLTASGTALEKCADWDFGNQVCLGTWTKLMDITPGQPYTFTLTPGDPGYAETGVASINTNKPVYHPGEQVHLTAVVLDTAGHLANADVVVTVTSPLGVIETFSTAAATIAETQKGIYEAVYTGTSETGNYSLRIQAIGENINSTLVSYFSVKDYYEFDILRSTPVTTDPWNGAFASSIKIVALTDANTFDFSEVLPASFTVTDAGGAVVTEQNGSKILTWHSLSNNSVVSYSALPPLVTPELYEIGPSYVTYSSTVFSEARPWYLAVDPVAAGEKEAVRLAAKGCMRTNDVGSPQQFTLNCAGAYPGACGANDRLSCIDSSTETVSVNNGNWGGFNITTFNNTVTDCGQIVSVRLCYNWTTSGASYPTCRVGTDLAGDLTWTTTASGCPTSTTATALVCTAVTAGESWSCSNFFGPSTTKAWGMIEAQRNGFGGPQTVTINALYFNVTYNQDSTAPNATIIIPPANSNISTNFLVNASVNDSGGGARYVNVTLLNSTGNATGLILMTLGTGTINAGYWNATINITNIPEGRYNISVNATDLAGNTNITLNVSILIDKSAANVSGVVPLNNSNFSSNFLVNASVNDSLSQVFNATFRLINPSATSAWLFASRGAGTASAGWWNTTVVVSGVADGLYNVTVNASDFAGNQRLVNVSQVRVDDTLPNATTILPVKEGNVSGVINVRAGANDTTSGVINVTYLFANSTNRTSIMLMSLASGTIYAGEWSSTFDTGQLAEGRYNITVNVTDFAGNQNLTNKHENFTMTVDRTLPNVSGVVPLNYSNFSSNFLVNASVNDSLSQVFNVTFKLINPSVETVWFFASRGAGTASVGWWNTTVVVSGVADGDYNITINATDFAGNQRLVNVSQVRVDDTLPNASGVVPLNNSNFSSNFLVNASVNDSLSQVFNVTFKLINPSVETVWFFASRGAGTASVGWWNTTVVVSGVADGVYNISVNASDFAGNQRLVNVSQVRVDDTLPNASGVVPLNNSNFSSNFLVNASVNDSLSQVFNATFRLISPSATSAWLFASRGAGTIGVGWWNTTAVVGGLTDGDYNITINATDYAGNQKVLNISGFALDRLAPNVSGVVPLNFSNLSSTFLINASVNDSVSSVFNVTFRLIRPGYIGSWLFASMGRGDISTGWWNTTASGVPDGTYNVTINATDFSGNQQLANISTLKVDASAPNISALLPTNGSNLDYWLSINISSNDSVTGIASIYFRLINNAGSTSWNALTLGSGNTSYGYWNFTNYDMSLVNDGYYNITINATDYAGNQRIANISSMSKFSLPPTINNISCFRSGVMINCTRISFGDTITAVQANCTSNTGGSAASGVTFSLRNIEHSTVLFNGTIWEMNNGFWVYDLPFTITNSGTFVLQTICFEYNQTVQEMNWTLPWGNLSVGLVSPNSNASVSPNSFFNFTAQVNCTGGECGYVNASLDPPNWWNSSWKRRQQINITNVGSTVLESFPAFINISNDPMMKPDYSDLRFINGTCSDISSEQLLLDYEIENYTATNASVWVRLLNMSLGNASICMYYSNPTAVSAANASAVWSSGYLGVWHLKELGNALRNDSTANGNLGNNFGAVGLKGVIDGAQYFNGASRIIVNRSTVLEPTDAITVTLWFKRNGTQAQWSKPLWYGQNNAAPWGPFGFEFNADSDTNIYFHTASTSTTSYNTGEYVTSDLTWYYFVGTFDGSYARLFVNSIYQSSSAINTAGLDNYGTYGLSIGDKAETGQQFTGWVDEVTISGVNRSQDWINESYQLVANQKNYVAYGAKEIYVKGLTPMNAGSPFYTTDENPMSYATNGCLADMIAGDSCNTTWNVNATGSANTAYELFVDFDPLNFTGYINSNTTKSINITIVDVNPPSITINIPLNASYVRGFITLNATTDEAATCKFSTDPHFNFMTSGTLLNATGGNTYSGNLGNLIEGVYSYYVKCGDVYGNNNTDSNQGATTFTVDNTLPNVLLIFPANNTNASTQPQISFIPSDNRALANCSLWGNFAGAWQLNQTISSPANASLNYFQPITLNVGTYIWNVQCFDNASNSAWNLTNFTFRVITMPAARNIECRESGAWKSCSQIGFGMTISALRANCTGTAAALTNATFNLTNIPDSQLLFSNSNSTQSSGFSVLDNLNYVINDSGQFNLTAKCIDAVGNYGINSTAWNVPWGTLNVSWISPNINTTVNQSQFFNFTAQVNCTGGECGYINATLDPTNWWNDNWINRREINITNRGDSVLGSFPVYLNVSYDPDMNPDYSDIRFVNGSCIGNSRVQLDYEIENYTNTNVTVWVKILNLSMGNTSICMYYGNDYAASAANASAVWSNGYVGVWHLKEIGNVLMNDSTANGNLGNNFASTSIAGVTDGGRYFNGGASVVVNRTAVLEPTTAITVTIWIRRNGAQAQWSKPLWYGQNNAPPYGPYGFEFNGDSDTDIYFHTASTTTTSYNTGVYVTADNTWYFLTGTYDNAFARFFVNGQYFASTSTFTPLGNYGTYGLGIGDKVETGQQFTGTIDEVTVSNVNRSQNWINQSYLLIANQGSLVNFGAEQNLSKGVIPMNSSSSPFYTISQNPMSYSNTSCLASMKLGNTCNITWTVNATGAGNTSYMFFVIFNPLNYSSYVSANRTKIINITILDLNPPSISNILPANGSFVKGSVTLSATTDESATCRFNTSATFNYATQGTAFSTTGGTVHINNLGALPEGFYSYYIKCNDTFGNINTNSNQGATNFTVDNTAPNATIEVPQNGTTVSSTYILINASVNDSASRVYVIWFKLTNYDGTSATSWLNASISSGNSAVGYWNATYSGGLLPNGRYNITINATDFVGNQRVSNISQILISTVGPNNTVIRPVAYANVTSMFLVNASINSTGVVQYVNVSLWNSTGNATGLIKMSLGAGTTGSGYWNATINAAALGLRDGYYNISVNATDAARNTVISDNVTILLDIVAANVSIIEPLNGTPLANQMFILNSTANDSLTGVLNVSFRLTNSAGSSKSSWIYAGMDIGTIYSGFWSSEYDSAMLANGRYNITINATDFAGNQRIVNVSWVDISNDLINLSVFMPPAKMNFSGSFFVNASINKTSGLVDRVNLTLINRTGRAYGPMPMSIGVGDATNGYWNITVDTLALGIRDAYYNISVNATDAAGNTVISSNVSATIDNTKPNVTLVAPINLTNELGSFLINVSANDSISKVFNVSFRVTNRDGTYISSWIYADMIGTIAIGYWNASFDITAFPQGRYNITANATDFSGNQRLVNISEIIYDTMLPNATITLPQQNANISGIFTVRASANDSISGIQNANLTIFNSTGNATGLVPMSLASGNSYSGYWTVNFDSASLIDGYYNISVNATDLGRNTNISANVSIIIDNTKPNVTGVVPANTSIFSQQPILINASANDSLTGVYNVSFRMAANDGYFGNWIYASMKGNIKTSYWNATVWGGSLPNDYYNITANVTDFAGNQRLVNISQIQISALPPNASIVVPAAWANLSGSIVVNASVNSSGTVSIVKLSLFNNTGLAYGPYSISLTSGDSSTGYWSSVLNTVTLNIRDAYYNLSINATDAGENTNITSNLSVTIDNTKPNATAVVPVNLTNVQGSFLINASVNDSPSRVFNATFRITNSDGSSSSGWIYASIGSGNYNSGYWNATFDTSALSQGRYNITINATDFAGNQRLMNMSEFIYDTVKPNNTIILPALNANISGIFTVRASVNDSASGISDVNLTLFNSTGNATVLVPMSLNSGTKFSGYWAVNFDSTALIDGYYNISVNATDLGRNTNISANVSIITDNTKPNITAVLPVNDTIYPGQDILINVSANDSISGLFNVSFKLVAADGTSTPWLKANLNPGTIKQGYWSAIVISDALVNGWYNITANVTDFAGNQRIVNISEVQYASAAPNNTIIAPFAGLNVSGTFVVNASANSTGTVSYVKVSLFNNTGLAYGPYAMSLTTGDNGAGYWSTALNTVTLTIRDAYYNLSVNATDAAGNSNITSNVSITIDNSKANVSVVVPQNLTNYLAPFLINASVNDTLSKVFNVSFQLTNSDGSSITSWIPATLGLGGINSGYWNATADLFFMPQGRYNVTINATDFAGNQRIVNISEIFKDSTAPNNTVIRPLAFSNISGRFSINASMNDSVAGIWMANFTLYNSTGNATRRLLPMTLYSGNVFAGYWNATVDSTTLQDGMYNISVEARDNVWGTNTSANVSITIDNTKANVSIITPQNGSTFEELPILINASVNDTASGANGVKFRLTTSDGSSISSWLTASISSGDIAIGYWNASISSTSLVNGVYNITINATDFAGNQQVINISRIQVANVAPNATILFPRQGMNISGSMIANASINDSGSVASAKLALLNSTGNATGWLSMTLRIGTVTSGYWDVTIDTTAIRDGYYNVSVNATDNVGNINISSNVSIAIDNTKPNASGVIPLNGSVFDDQLFLINASANDSVTGIFNATFRLASPDSATAWIYASKGAGSVLQGYWNATIDSSTIKDGYYNITLNATDFAGNQMMVNISSIIIDNNPPNTTIIFPTQNSNISGNFLVNASINDSGAVVQFVNVSFLRPGSTALGPIIMSLGSGTNSAGYWNATIGNAALPDGRYNISINATNSNSHTNISANISIVIDNTPPNATIVTPANGTNASGNILINASVNDSGTGVSGASFRIIAANGTSSSWLVASISSGNMLQGFWNATFNTAALPDGTYNITVNATDYAGNKTLINISKITIDNTLPTITLNSPQNNTFNSSRNITFTYTPNDLTTGIINCSLLLNGTINTTAFIIQNSQPNNFTVQNFNEGVYLWAVQCADYASNRNATLNYTLTIDWTAPSASITTQNGSSFATGMPNITILLNDNLVPVINYTIFVNRQADDNGTASRNIAKNSTLTIHSNGTYSVVVEALDLAGNRFNSSPINITIDTVKPTINLSAPANGSSIGVSTIHFNFTAYDNLADNLSCNLVIDNTINATRQAFNATSVNVSVSNFTTGLHNWTVNCSDDAGNINVSDMFFFNITKVDLYISTDNITFNTTAFEEGKNFTIIANISNIGGSQANNFLIEIFNGTPGIGRLLYSTTASLAQGASVSVNTSAVFGIGTFTIYVRLDGNSLIDELSEDNNLANKSLTVPLWNIIYGNVTGDYALENTTLSTIFKWIGAGNSTGNIFVTDYDSAINWGNLIALGRNTTGTVSKDDFGQLDTALNSTGYDDSVNRTFTRNSQPLSTGNLVLFGKTITNVPFVNSTNSTNFVTGIVWDSGQDTNGEYDGTEDVLFVTNLSRSTRGAYGVYDYELRVPALLRNYKGPNMQMVAFYLELK